MQEIEISGQIYDLRHLQGFVVSVNGKGKDGDDLQVAVSFSLHVISESCENGRQNLTDENGKPRRFCKNRHAFSLGLPEIVRRMILQNYSCWESTDRNRSLNYAIVDAAPINLRKLQNGEYWVIFFYLYPSKTHLWHVDFVITSCHSRQLNFDKIKRRYSIHSQLRACLYEEKRKP